MRLHRRAREFERTCDDCGYTWRVPRSAARRRRGISAYSHMPRGTYRMSDSEPEIAAAEAVSAVDAAYGPCPRCDSDRYTQQPVRPWPTKARGDTARIVGRESFLARHQLRLVTSFELSPALICHQTPGERS